MNPADDRVMRARFAGLRGPDDGDWSEVRERARRRLGRPVILGTAVAIALVGAGLAVGGHVLPFPFPTPKPSPAGPPVQHATTRAASIDVYRNGTVTLQFTSASGDLYRRLAAAEVGPEGLTIACEKVSFGGDRWRGVAGRIGNASLAPRMLARIHNPVQGPSVPPPFDYCELGGTYGRYWNDEEGPHELVELPFTAMGRRYLDERATARDLAYFVRTKRLHRIRLAIHRGERGPSAQELARIFGPRLVPLASHDSTAPRGKVGLWTDGKLIVASELTPSGRRLYVTVRGTRIGATNIRDLAFPF